MKGQEVVLSEWGRRRHYEFYRTFANPWFSVCTTIDVSGAYRACKARGVSFSRACWYAVVLAANEQEAFRLRLREGGVWLHEMLSISTTIMLEGDAFAFCYFPHARDFEEFLACADEAIKGAKEAVRGGGSALAEEMRDDVLFGTTLPWVEFTSVSHPRKGDACESTPIVTLGKVSGDGVWRMPVGVDAHHALMDGVHVARFFERLEELLSEGEFVG